VQLGYGKHKQDGGRSPSTFVRPKLILAMLTSAARCHCTPSASSPFRIQPISMTHHGTQARALLAALPDLASPWSSGVSLATAVAMALVLPPFLALLLLETDEASCIDHMFPWSPARQEISYSWRMYTDVAFHIDSIYLGSPVPNEKVDQAWTELMPCECDRLYLRKLANSSRSASH